MLAAPTPLRIGQDVPWVTSWTGEALLGPRLDPLFGGALTLTQADRPGQGRPIWSQNHLGRQRVSVARLLCPMCGRPTAAGDRWSLTATATTAGRLRAEGRAAGLASAVPDRRPLLDLGAIAPGHHACLTAAAERCPHLGARDAANLRRTPERLFILPLLVAPAISPLNRPAPPALAFLQLCALL